MGRQRNHHHIGFGVMQPFGAARTNEVNSFEPAMQAATDTNSASQGAKASLRSSLHQPLQLLRDRGAAAGAEGNLVPALEQRVGGTIPQFLAAAPRMPSDCGKKRNVHRSPSFVWIIVRD